MLCCLHPPPVTSPSYQASCAAGHAPVSSHRVTQWRRRVRGATASVSPLSLRLALRLAVLTQTSSLPRHTIGRELLGTSNVAGGYWLINCVSRHSACLIGERIDAVVWCRLVYARWRRVSLRLRDVDEGPKASFRR